MEIADPIPRYDYASAMGTTILAYSKLEAVFSMIVDHIYDESNGSEIEEDKPVTSMARKIRVVKKWYKHHEFIQITNPWIPKYLTTLKNSATTRSYLAHGIYSYEKTTIRDNMVEVAVFTMKVKGEWKSQMFPIERLDGLTTSFGLTENVWRAFGRFLTQDKSVGTDGLENAINDITEKLLIHETTFYDAPNILTKKL